MSTLTGPKSKDSHAGGKEFKPKLRHRSTDYGKFTNSPSSDAAKKIKGLKYKAENDKWGQDPLKVLKKKPS